MIIRRLVIFILIVGFAWYVYGETFEETGIAGVYEDVREDIVEIIAHPVVQNSVDWVKREVQLFSDWLEEEKSQTTSPKQPELEAPSDQFSIHNIELGDRREEVQSELGKPQRASLNEYGVHWVSYHENYHHFVMVAYDDKNKVCGLFTNHDLIRSDNGITLGSSKQHVLSVMPSPLEIMRKGLVHYQIHDDGQYHIFDIDTAFVTVFYDEHRNHEVTSLLLIDKALEEQKQDYFGKPSEALKEGFEYQLFDLTNATRVKHGLSPLVWEEAARETVRNHSKDMAVNNYFSHTNLEGLSPFDRLSEDAISYTMAGENLASGQPSSIFAHEGLMNSMGHRENKLKNGYQSMSVGVAFNEDGQPFYTENYLAK